MSLSTHVRSSHNGGPRSALVQLDVRAGMTQDMADLFLAFAH